MGLDAALLTCLVLGHGLDMGSTEVALRRPNVVEGNVFMKNRGVRISFNVVEIGAEYRILHKKSKKVKLITCGALLGVRTALSVRNLEVGK